MSDSPERLLVGLLEVIAHRLDNSDTDDALALARKVADVVGAARALLDEPGLGLHGAFAEDAGNFLRQALNALDTEEE
jgi:hypothetical protein